MFQKIVNNVEQNNSRAEQINIKENIISKIRDSVLMGDYKKNICISIIGFLISMVSCGLDMAPFGIAIIAAACSNGIPVGLLYILTIIGTAISFGKDGVLTYILTTAIFITLTLLKRNKLSEKFMNEKKMLGINVIISVLIVQVVKVICSQFLVYDILLCFASAITTYIFYKIFSNSLIVINEFGNKAAFAIEEVIGASLMLAIAFSAFGNINIYGFEIKNILCILIVLILGWKNGILLGATSGITIGTVLGIVGSGSPVMIAAYAVSGMLAGIFSKIGKIGVIIGFVIGNLIITYTTNGNTVEIIHLKEILIASLGLFVIPQNLKIAITALIKSNLCFPIIGDKQIEDKQSTISKLNNVSETIKEISNTYKEDNNEDINSKNKKIFLEELENNLEELEDNIIYDDVICYENGIIDDIFEKLLEQNSIDRNDLIEIFKKHNNYIIGFDDLEKDKVKEKDIDNMIKVINSTYKISKVNFIWKQKMDENKKVMSEQLKGVSKVISSLAQEIENNNDERYLKEKEEIKKLANQKNIDLLDLSIKREKSGRYIIYTYLKVCIDDSRKCPLNNLLKILSKVLKDDIIIQNEKCAYKREENICKTVFVSKNKYDLQVGISKITKEGSSVSGDSYLKIKLNDGKCLLAISDGKGSGPEARKSSQIAIKMLKRLLVNGFDKDTSIDLINSTLSLNTDDDMYATLDLAILDMYNGNIEFIKNGACPTFIKNKQEIKTIKSLSLPAGLLDNIDLVIYDKDIEAEDIIVMCSDGILESNQEYENKEEWIRKLLKNISTISVQKIADIILKEAIDNSYGIPKDDMTVIVAKFKKIEK